MIHSHLMIHPWNMIFLDVDSPHEGGQTPPLDGLQGTIPVDDWGGSTMTMETIRCHQVVTNMPGKSLVNSIYVNGYGYINAYYMFNRVSQRITTGWC